MNKTFIVTGGLVGIMIMHGISTPVMAQTPAPETQQTTTQESKSSFKDSDIGQVVQDNIKRSVNKDRPAVLPSSNAR